MNDHIIYKQKDFYIFHSNVNAFYFLSYLIILVRNSSTIFNKTGEREHFCLAPNLTGKLLSFSLLSVILEIIWGSVHVLVLVLFCFCSCNLSTWISSLLFLVLYKFKIRNIDEFCQIMKWFLLFPVIFFVLFWNLICLILT